MDIHSNVGRRVRDSRRLREIKETGETVGTNEDALQCRKESKEQLETDRDQGDWRDCGDLWICTQVKK